MPDGGLILYSPLVADWMEEQLLQVKLTSAGEGKESG